MNTATKAFVAAIMTVIATASYACPTCIGRLENDARPFFMQEHDTSTAVDVIDKDEKKHEPQEQRPLLKGLNKS